MPYDENSGSSRQNAAFCLPQSSVNPANRRFPIGISTEALLCLRMQIPEAPGQMPLFASHRGSQLRVHENPRQRVPFLGAANTGVVRWRSEHVDQN